MAVKEQWKIGELAKLTGITVRTLHHYDQIGLLVPTLHSDSGHRLYSRQDIARLQQIIGLKQLGFRLNESKELLNHPHFRPDETIRLQLRRVNEQILLHEELRHRLEGLYEMLRIQEDATVEQLIQTIKVMKMTEKYFTPDQMSKIRKQGELLGSKKIKEIENEWLSLVAKVRSEMEKDTSPQSCEVKALAKRWKELVNLFTGGDHDIAMSVKRYYADNPDKAAEFGIDKQVWQYISKAMANSSEY